MMMKTMSKLWVLVLAISSVAFGQVPIIGSPVNGVIEATSFHGADIGANVNSAVAEMGSGCGTITIAPGNYSFSTQIWKPRCVIIEGNNSVLTWTGTNVNTPAIIIGSPAGIDYTIGEIRHLKLVGPTTTPGIYLGGSSGSYVGTASPTFSSNSDYLDKFEDVTVTGFLDNYVKGNNAYQDIWVGGASTSGNHSNFLDTGVFGSENMAFYGWQSLNSPGYGFYSANLDGAEYNFTDCSFDYNSNGAFYYINGNVRLKGGHIEQNTSAYMFNSPASSSAFSLVLSGGVQFVEGYTSMPALIYVGGTNSDVFIDDGINIAHPGSTISELVNWQALGLSNQLTVGAYADPLANTGVTIPTVQSGANIQWLDIPTYTQYVPTGRYQTFATIGMASIGIVKGSVATGLLGAINNGCPSATQGVDFPYNGTFMGWNCDTTGGSDFFAPFIASSGTAYHFHAKLADGTWADIFDMGRTGSASWGGGSTISNSTVVCQSTTTNRNSCTGTDVYWTVASACSTTTGQPAHCAFTTTLPIAMPDANYQIFCTANVYSAVGGGNPDYSCSPQILGALPTASGSTLNFDVVQTMQNGGGGGTATVYLHAHHN